MSIYNVSWSENSENMVKRLVEEKGVERNCIKSITLSLHELEEILKEGRNSLNDFFDNVLFGGKSAQYRVYSISHIIVGIVHGTRIEVVVWAEDSEV
jgi:hypothetical protein